MSDIDASTQWSVLKKRLMKHFQNYGGVRGIIYSPFFIAALPVALVGYNKWESLSWIKDVQSLIPSMLGFSLGTYAIIFSIVSKRVKAAMQAITKKGVSHFDRANSTFLHFIFTQVICLIYSFAFESIDYLISKTDFDFRPISLPLSAFGYFLLIYSILLMIASALAVYRIASIKDYGDQS